MSTLTWSAIDQKLEIDKKLKIYKNLEIMLEIQSYFKLKK